VEMRPLRLKGLADPRAIDHTMPSMASSLRCRLVPAHLDVPAVVVKRAPPSSSRGLFVRLHPDKTIAELWCLHPTGTVRMWCDVGEVLCRFDDDVIYVDGTRGTVVAGQGLPARVPLPRDFSLASWLHDRLQVIMLLATERE
jgi:hypothetical protein